MKRKDFLMISSLSAIGITLIPRLVSQAIRKMNGVKLLRKNLHNRHGYFGEEFFINRLDDLDEVEVKIDHFDNPEGDLIHIQINTNEETYRLAYNTEEILWDKSSHIKTILQSDIKRKSWIKNEKIALLSQSSLKEVNSDIKYIIPLGTDKLNNMPMYESISSLPFKEDQIYLAFL